VFQPGQSITYSATLTTTAADQGGAYTIVYDVTNLAGTAVSHGTLALTLPNGTGTAEISFTVPAQPNGYYQTTFDVIRGSDAQSASSMPSTSSSVLETRSTGLAVVPPAPNLYTLDPGSPFGINGPGNQYGPIPPSLEQQWTRVYQLFKTQGIQWARTQFLWQDVEPTPGVYTWNTSDGLLEAAHAAHENLLGLVDYAGAYANPFNPASSVSFTTFLQDYDQYIQALVARYMPGGTLAQQMGWSTYGITTWEIWNEPSTKRYWPSQNPAQYAELVQSAAAAIKAVDPNATVLAYNWQEPTLVQTAGTSFTGVSIHDYPQNPSTPGYYPLIANLRQLLAAHGLGSDPIWMTETGWSTKQVTPLQQAEYVERAAIASLAASLNKFFLFDWSYPSAGYGELSKALRPFPAYPALATVASALNGYTPAAGLNPLNMGTAVRAFIFQNGSQSLAALWSPTADGTLTLNGASGITATDWMGNPLLATGSSMTVPLDGQPVFVSAAVPPQQLATLIQGGTIGNVPPISAAIQSTAGSSDRLASIAVTLTNQVNVPEAGTVTLNLPSGWEAAPAPTAPGGSATGSTTPTAAFGPLAPGASIVETFDVTRYETSPAGVYPVTASVTVNGTPTSTTSNPTVTTALGPAPGLAAMLLNPGQPLSAVTFTPDSAGAAVTITDHGAPSISLSLNRGPTLTLEAAAHAAAIVSPARRHLLVRIRRYGTTTINLVHDVTPGLHVTLTASVHPLSGTSAVLTVTKGIRIAAPHRRPGPPLRG
jgi:hypothetical protein